MERNRYHVLIGGPIRRSLPILEVGSCEPLKAVVHGTALGLAALMAAYNTAAWLGRRQRHLALNAVIYTVAIFWESRHVAHHRRCSLPDLVTSEVGPDGPAPEEREAA